ncbi:hypothetical protein AN214_04043 [Pseudoalteromonas sp. P1-9]|nr:hypothetical protein AN214_04043 [Pseudoalteromonas sp. P1-9]
MEKSRGFFKEYKSVLFFSIVILTISLTVAKIFYGRFGFDIEAELSDWVDYAVYFNNALSPVMLIVTVILIFLTLHINKREVSLLTEQNKKILELTEQVEIYKGIKPLIEESIEEMNNFQESFIFMEEYSCEINSKKVYFADSEVHRTNIENVEDYLVESFQHGESEKPFSKKYKMPQGGIFERTCKRFNKIAINQKIKGEVNFETVLEMKGVSTAIKRYKEINNSAYCYKDLFRCFYKEKQFSLSHYEYYFVCFEGENLKKFMERIEYIATMLSILRDGTNQKLIISEFIYYKLDRWVLYGYLEYLSMYIDSKHRKDEYFKTRFDEITKIIAIKEFPAMTEQHFVSENSKELVPKELKRVSKELQKVYKIPIYKMTSLEN